MRGHSRLDRLRNRLCIWQANRDPGIDVAHSAYLARGVRLQTSSDGMFFGGRITIAEHVTLADRVIVATYGGSVEIGEDAYIGPAAILYGHGDLVIGRNTMIAGHTVIVPANHGFQNLGVPMRDQPLTRFGIEIGEDVWIGAGCKILDGVRVGSGSIIGAGSVVTRDIAPGSVAVGVPAKVIRHREQAG